MAAIHGDRLQSGEPGAIRGIADVAFRLQDWPSALTNYQKVLTALDESDNESRTDVYYRLEVFTQTGSEGYDLMGLTQQQLINHYGLNLREPKAKEFLFQNMEQFLFARPPVA